MWRERLTAKLWLFVKQIQHWLFIGVCLSSASWLLQLPPEVTSRQSSVGLTHTAGAPANTASGNELLAVSITGAIVQPGVYRLSDNSLVQDLITAAGGLTKNADHYYIGKQLTLAAKLKAGQQLYIPSVTEQQLVKELTTKSPAETLAGEVQGKVNLNTASLEQLDTLPGVGPALAARIVAARPFITITDLQEVSGIGDATYLKLEPYLEV